MTPGTNTISSVRIVEVGPRDGLQNHSSPLGVNQRIELVDMLSDAGFSEIEAGAFVSPVWVPQMMASRSVFAGIKRRPSTVYTALVPNVRGCLQALEVNASKVALFTAASESFNQKNINASIRESIDRFVPVVEKARERHLPLRAYVSTAFDCPYENKISPEKVLPVVRQLLDLDIQDISIGDTIGKATSDDVRRLLDVLLNNDVPAKVLGMHFHDTCGNAIENVKASLEYGISVFDSSIGGIGGCPYAPGAKGNVSTRDLVNLFHGLGIYTGIDADRLADAELYLIRATQTADTKNCPEWFMQSTNSKFSKMLKNLFFIARSCSELRGILMKKPSRLPQEAMNLTAADFGDLRKLFKDQFRQLKIDFPEEFQIWTERISQRMQVPVDAIQCSETVYTVVGTILG